MNQMKTFTAGGKTYEIVDETARNKIANLSEKNCANALKGTASGTGVIRFDVSPIEHKISAKVSGNASKVYALGKNFIQTPFNDGNINVNGLTITQTGDGGVMIDGTPTAAAGYYFNSRLKLRPGVYTFSGTDKLNIENCIFTMYIRDVDAAATIKSYELTTTQKGRRAFFTIDEEKDVAVYFVVNSIKTDCVFNGYIYPQIEVGEGFTDFEKGIAPVEYAVSDGIAKGVMSIYPTTTLYTDASGVVIEAEYNKDLNKVFGDIDSALDAIIAIQESYISESSAYSLRETSEEEILEETLEGGGEV